MAFEHTPIDDALRDAVTLRFNLGPKIEFQFPPKITTDSRKGEWYEGNLQGTEPIATFQKSGPREISLTWSYIVTGGVWTTEKISQQVKAIRGYFARYRDQNNLAARNLILFFQMWAHGDPSIGKQMSCRIKSVDVKHTDTIVAPNGDPSVAYPLRTDIVVDLRLWTKGGPEPTQDLEGLLPNEEQFWY